MPEKICRICREPFEPVFSWVQNCPSCWERYLKGEQHLKAKSKKEREQKTLV